MGYSTLLFDYVGLKIDWRNISKNQKKKYFPAENLWNIFVIGI